ncbi:hypothetical protein GCM10029992_15440 [Glycomyces albus]
MVRAAVELADDPATMRRVQEAWTELERDLTSILAKAVDRGEAGIADPGGWPARSWCSFRAPTSSATPTRRNGAWPTPSPD